MKRSHKYIFFGLTAILFTKHLIPYLKDFPMFAGYMTMRTNVLLGMFLFIGIELADAESGNFKNKSYKILADNLGSTITSSKADNETIGEWTAIRLGGFLIPVFGVVMAGREGTLITHRLAVDEKEGGDYIQCKAKQTPKDSLPREIKNLVEEKSMPEPYYFGTAPAEVEKQNQSYINRENLWKDIKTLENRRDELHEELQNTSRSVMDLKKDLSTGADKGEIQRLKEKMNSNED